MHSPVCFFSFLKTSEAQGNSGEQMSRSVLFLTVLIVPVCKIRIDYNM